ncbi:MAG: tail fiber domain-containing protein [Verrucomicrobiota bacterium]
MQDKQHNGTWVRRWVSAAMAGAFLAMAHGTMAQATPKPPERMTYQGFLTGADGVALGNSAPKAYDVLFRIYDAEQGGTLLWGEQQTVTVDKGYFSVLLGEGAAVSGVPNAGIVFSSLFTGATASDRFVGVTVKGIGTGGTDVDILPRVRFLSSPYAYLAASAVKLVQTTGADLLTSSGNTVTVSGSLVANGLTAGTIDATNSVRAGILAASTNITTPVLMAGAVTVTNGLTAGSISAGAITASSVTSSGSLNVPSIAASGAITAQGNIDGDSLNVSGITIKGTGVLDLGAALTKGLDNGKIGYGTWQSNTLCIVGGGLSQAARATKVWGRLSTQGGSLNVNADQVYYPMSVYGQSADGYGLHVDRGVICRSLFQFSDARTKDVLGHAGASADLEMLRKIKVTDYQMKGRRPGDQRRFKGVIAQELRNTMPDAVAVGPNIIPTSPRDAVAIEWAGVGQLVTVRLGERHGIGKGERVLIEVDGQESSVIAAEVPNEESFSYAGAGDAPKAVRLIGREVKDFLSVDYQQIYMTAVSALQEVDRRLGVVEQREARVAELERKAARVDALDRDVAELTKKAAQVAALERDVAELRKLLSSMVTPPSRTQESAAVSPRPASASVAQAR